MRNVEKTDGESVWDEILGLCRGEIYILAYINLIKLLAVMEYGHSERPNLIEIILKPSSFDSWLIQLGGGNLDLLISDNGGLANNVETG